MWKEIGGSARMISGTPISEALFRPQDLRAQQLQESQPASKLPQGTAPGETWLLRACL